MGFASKMLPESLPDAPKKPERHSAMPVPAALEVNSPLSHNQTMSTPITREELDAKLAANVAGVELAAHEMRADICELRAEYQVHNATQNEKINALRAETQAQFADMRAETKAQFADMRAETKAQFADMRAETQAQFADMRAETKAQFADMRAETQAQFSAMRAETQAMFSALRTETQAQFSALNDRMASMQNFMEAQAARADAEAIKTAARFECVENRIDCVEKSLEHKIDVLQRVISLVATLAGVWIGYLQLR